MARITIAGMAMIVGRPLDPAEDIDPLSPSCRKSSRSRQSAPAISSPRRSRRGSIARSPSIRCWRSATSPTPPPISRRSCRRGEARCAISRAPLRKFLDDLCHRARTSRDARGGPASRDPGASGPPRRSSRTTNPRRLPLQTSKRIRRRRSWTCRSRSKTSRRRSPSSRSLDRRPAVGNGRCHRAGIGTGRRGCFAAFEATAATSEDVAGHDRASN